MMSGLKTGAICSEAVAAMGTIRTAIRAYYVEYQAYPSPTLLYFYSGSAWETKLGLKYADFEGRYFRPHCYYVKSSSTTCDIYAVPDPTGWQSGLENEHPEAKALTDTTAGRLWMKKDGTILQIDFSKSGYRSP